MNLEQYLCGLLAEEANETAKEVSKVSRFGADGKSAIDGVTSFQKLENEISDYHVVLNLLYKSLGKELSYVTIDLDAQREKERKILIFTEVSARAGRISATIPQELQALTVFKDESYPLPF